MSRNYAKTSPNMFWESKQCIVTGGGGFLGSHVVDAIRAAGCQNIFVPRKTKYELTQASSVERMYEDARLAREGARDTIVFHLAGLSGGIGVNRARPADFYYQNTMLNTLVYEYGRKYGITCLVAAGAGISYPITAPSPLTEDKLWDGLPQSESSAYALSKRMLHLQSLVYWQQYRMPSTVLILASLYGPKDNFNTDTAPVVPSLISRIFDAVNKDHKDIRPWGTGKATRDFLYVKDAALSFVRAAEQCRDSQAINIASGIETSIHDIVHLLIDIIGYKGNVVWDTLRPEGALNRHFDTSKAIQKLGWSATTTLHDGLQETVEWYKKCKNA